MQRRCFQRRCFQRRCFQRPGPQRPGRAPLSRPLTGHALHYPTPKYVRS